MIRISAAIAAVALAASLPAAAQDSAGEIQGADEKVNQLIIYGEDACPESTDDEIVVCARLAEEDRYRIPKNLRGTDNDPTKEAWSRRVLAYEYVGADGIQSCSPSGAGGFTGCGLNAIDNAYAEKEYDPGKLFARLIAEKRAERLAGIDAEAEEVEQRIKQFEKDRRERAEREEAARNGVVVTGGDEADEAAVDAQALPQPE
ncbi:MAG: hypothetical protein V3V15_08765 [Sphingorhabdus sp.]